MISWEGFAKMRTFGTPLQANRKYKGWKFMNLLTCEFHVHGFHQRVVELNGSYKPPPLTFSAKIQKMCAQYDRTSRPARVVAELCWNRAIQIKRVQCQATCPCPPPTPPLPNKQRLRQLCSAMLGAAQPNPSVMKGRSWVPCSSLRTRKSLVGSPSDPKGI